MLCVRAEDALAAAAAAAVASDKMRSVTLGGSIQRALRRMAGGGGRRSASRGSGDGDALGPAISCSGDDSSIGSAKREGGRRGSMQLYRLQLEQEVKKLQRELQDEIDLHLTLVDAITHNAALILNSSIKLPDKAQELIISTASLEIAISKLETDLHHLHYELCYIRNERLLAETNPRCMLLTSSDCQPSTTYIRTGEEDVSKFGDSPSTRSTSTEHEDQQNDEKHSEDREMSKFEDSRLGDSPSTRSMQVNLSTEHEDQQNDEKHSEDREMVYVNRLLEKHQDVPLTRLLGLQDKEMQESCSMEKQGKENSKIDLLQFSQSDLKENSFSGNLQNNPNQLSEEMVRSMRDIFLRLSASSHITPKAPFDNSSSSAERLSNSTLTSLSDSSVIASVLHSPSVDFNQDDITMDEIINFDPYNANGKETRRDIGCYCSVAEVSWMYVGNEQLEYASGALKKFRFPVTNLPSAVNSN